MEHLTMKISSTTYLLPIDAVLFHVLERILEPEGVAVREEHVMSGLEQATQYLFS